MRQHIEIPPSPRPTLSWRCPGLQPIPEHSGAGNQLTEGSDKRRRSKVRNTGSNGIPLGELQTRLLLNALQHCIGVITVAKAYCTSAICHAVLMERKLKAYNELCIYYKVDSICLQTQADYVTFLFEKRFLLKECKEHSIVCISALMIINKIVLVVH